MLIADARHGAALHAQAVQQLHIPLEAGEIGRRALYLCGQKMELGRASVDVVFGRTDCGDVFKDAVDLSPRVSGMTPAEALGINTLLSSDSVVQYASGRLYYEPHMQVIPPGTRFVDTQSLIINVQTGEGGYEN